MASFKSLYFDWRAGAFSMSKIAIITCGVLLILGVTTVVSAQDAGQAPNRCAASPAIASLTASPSWNGWGADVGNTRFQPAAAAQLNVADVQRLQLKWAFGLPGARAVSGQPTVVAGRVFVSSDTGDVYALDSESGCVYWSFHADAAVRSAVTVERAGAGKAYAVFFGDARANVYALDMVNGTPLWKARVEDHPLARITGGVRTFEGRVYVPVASSEEGAGSNKAYECCTSRGSVVALDAATGKQVWKTYMIPDAPKPTTTNAAGTQLWGPSGAGVWNSPTIDPRRRALYVGTGNAYSAPAAPTTDAIVAMDIDTGKILWSAQGTADDVWLSVCITNAALHCGPDQDFGSPPILKTLSNGKSLLVAGQKSGNVWAYDPDKKGRVVWRSPLVANTTEFGGKIVWGGAADEQNAYFGLGPGGIAAVRLSDGQRQWFVSPPTAGSPARPGQDGALTVIPGAVISGGWDGVLRLLSSSDGHTMWEYNTARDVETVNHVAAHGGSMGAPGPVVAGGLLFVPSGYVGVRNGAPGNVLLVFGVER
jgi:polyvinyl alcohol dehydrogenase (cytochrome)